MARFSPLLPLLLLLGAARAFVTPTTRVRDTTLHAIEAEEIGDAIALQAFRALDAVVDGGFAAGDVLQNKVAPALAQGGDAAAETLKTKVLPAVADGAEAFQTNVVPAVGDAIITGAAGAGDAFYASIQAARDAGVSDSALATGAVIWVAVTGAAIARKATPPPPPPPTPAEKAAAAAQSAVNAGFKAFEVVQGRPYTPLKSKAVEDAVKPIANSAINIYKATESAAKAAPTFTPKLTKTLEKAYKDAPSVSAKLGQQAQTALSRKAQETQRAAQEAAKRAAARGGPYAQQLQARATQAAAKQTELLRKQAAEQAKAAAAVASKQPAFQQVSRTYSSVAPAVTKAYATAAPVIKNTAVKYAAVPAGEALRKASQELQKTKEYKTFAAKPEAAIGVGAFLFATVIALAAPKPAKIVAPPPPPEPVVVVAPSITAIKALDVSKVKLPEVDVSKVKLPEVDASKALESIKKIDVSKVKVPDVSTIDVSKASAQLGDAAKKTTAEASKTISKAAQDAGPAIGAFTADVAVPALKYGADETTKAASAAASQVAVEASKVDWAGLAEGALEQTVVFLVYVPVFAYTFAASLPAEEQFVLGLVVLLVVGSFAKQDD